MFAVGALLCITELGRECVLCSDFPVTRPQQCQALSLPTLLTIGKGFLSLSTVGLMPWTMPCLGGGRRQSRELWRVCQHLWSLPARCQERPASLQGECPFPCWELLVAVLSVSWSWSSTSRVAPDVGGRLLRAAAMCVVGAALLSTLC